MLTMPGKCHADLYTKRDSSHLMIWSVVASKELCPLCVYHESNECSSVQSLVSCASCEHTATRLSLAVYPEMLEKFESLSVSDSIRQFQWMFYKISY